MTGKPRKPAPPAAVPGARVLIDDASGAAANAQPRSAAAATAAPAAPATPRKRRPRFVF